MNRQLATGYWLLATGYRLPTTDNRQPTTDNRQPTTLFHSSRIFLILTDQLRAWRHCLEFRLQADCLKAELATFSEEI
ncbi:MAG: hypothetical protein SF339_03840 [Blastocatellia bacterium]|nr:hypothetical protein [Blastocatellia bacterium]